jgi:hypothetical protein
MSRKFMIAFLAATFVAAPLALSGSAMAEVNNTTTRSNTQHNITAPKSGNGNAQQHQLHQNGGHVTKDH